MYTCISGQRTSILNDDLLRRRQANRDYMMRLDGGKLLVHHASEAGVVNDTGPLAPYHGGWESPYCQLRGHFVGHWLSAAAMHYAATGDTEVKARADRMVAELAQYQQFNGGRWVAPIPEKYMDWIANGRKMWAPQYTIHKTLMGLLDMYLMAGNEQALAIATEFAKWFHDWSARFPIDQWGDILDVETGGMLEIWAELYGITGEPFAKELMERYDRERLFQPLLEGEDALTNMHANTTIPEVLGAARAFEVTGEQRWMDIVLAYWKQAVEDRGTYCTGGATCGEIWGPKIEASSARLGEKNQEHCTVYNMMRLADFLFRHTGEARFADYWEQNLYNGIMAQAYWKGSFTHGNKSNHPDTGLLTYFLPLQSGGHKAWASETEDFFCCHGSLVQANAAHNQGIYYHDETRFAICQYLSSKTSAQMDGADVCITQKIDALTGSRNISSVQDYSQKINAVAAEYPHNPKLLVSVFDVSCSKKASFKLLFRIPWWCFGEYTLLVDGKEETAETNSEGFIALDRAWEHNTIELRFNKPLSSVTLRDKPDMVALMDGPVVLAGLCDEERVLYGDPKHPEDILVADNEREWSLWQNTYRTTGQDRGIRFVPLYQVGYEAYSVYFPIRQSSLT